MQLLQDALVDGYCFTSPFSFKINMQLLRCPSPLINKLLYETLTNANFPCFPANHTFTIDIPCSRAN